MTIDNDRALEVAIALTDPAQPTWAIDPIDATGNYDRGIEVFATLVALVVDANAALSVVSAPAQHTRW